jgi:hypothetical protein
VVRGVQGNTSDAATTGKQQVLFGH